MLCDELGTALFTFPLFKMTPYFLFFILLMSSSISFCTFFIEEIETKRNFLVFWARPSRTYFRAHTQLLPPFLHCVKCPCVRFLLNDIALELWTLFFPLYWKCLLRIKLGIMFPPFTDSTPPWATTCFLYSWSKQKILEGSCPLTVAISSVSCHSASPLHPDCLSWLDSRGSFPIFQWLTSCRIQQTRFSLPPFSRFKATFYPNHNLLPFLFLALSLMPHSPTFTHISLIIPFHYLFLITPPLPNYLILEKRTD